MCAYMIFLVLCKTEMVRRGLEQHWTSSRLIYHPFLDLAYAVQMPDLTIGPVVVIGLGLFGRQTC